MNYKSDLFNPCKARRSSYNAIEIDVNVFFYIEAITLFVLILFFRMGQIATYKGSSWQVFECSGTVSFVVCYMTT